MATTSNERAQRSTLMTAEEALAYYFEEADDEEEPTDYADDSGEDEVEVGCLEIEEGLGRNYEAVEPALLDSALCGISDLTLTDAYPEDLPPPQHPPVEAVNAGQPPVPKRPRGRPKKGLPARPRARPPAGPAVPPPKPMRPSTPPPPVDATAQRQFREFSVISRRNIADFPKKLTPDQAQEKYRLLREENEQRSEVFGDWLWEDYTDDELSINQGVEFTAANQGLLGEAKEADTELSFLQLFLTDTVVQNLVEQTNRYANQRGARERKEGFKDVTPVSVQAYIGVVIAMGLCHKSRLDGYWTTEPVLATPWFPGVMSRKCYRDHQHFLHVVDNAAPREMVDGKPSDKLYKLRPLLESFFRSFRESYGPGRELSIDEMMIGTKCRLGFIQYMKDKPTKWGVKVWTLCDSKVHYCLAFDVYTGGTGEKGLSTRVVNQLMSPYLGVGHRLYIDNFYTSPDLLAHLLHYDTLAVGTVRNNRIHMPMRLRPAEFAVEVGQSLFVKSHGMTACRWKDKRDVFVLSTVHGKSLTELPRRRRGKEGGVVEEVVSKPTMITDYNAFMGGVDVFDQLLSYHPLTRRYKRWWMKIFWRLIDMAILNAFALWKLKHNTKPGPCTHIKFRLALIKALVAPQMLARNMPPRILHGCRAPRPHKFSQRRQCEVCNSTTNPTHEGCLTCGPAIRLHLLKPECFYQYHFVNK